jgi:hypothetical protein
MLRIQGNWFNETEIFLVVVIKPFSAKLSDPNANVRLNLLFFKKRALNTKRLVKNSAYESMH